MGMPETITDDFDKYVNLKEGTRLSQDTIMNTDSNYNFCNIVDTGNNRKSIKFTNPVIHQTFTETCLYLDDIETSFENVFEDYSSLTKCNVYIKCKIDLRGSSASVGMNSDRLTALSMSSSEQKGHVEAVVSNPTSTTITTVNLLNVVDIGSAGFVRIFDI
jgi:hypothetical protein